MAVRCILIATVAILQFSNTVKCSDKVENGDEIQTFINFNNKYQTFPRTFTENIQNDLKTRSNLDVSKVKENYVDFKQEKLKRECGNSLCKFFKNHRVIRQVGYSPMYPQLPTSYPYRQPNNTHQPSTQYGNNPYPSYSKPVVPIIPYQNPTINVPVHNSSYSHFPNNNISNNNFQNSRHTYPPSPRPSNSQPLPNYGTNPTSVHLPNNSPYHFNVNQPTNSFGYVPKPGYPYPRSNFTNYNTFNNRTQGGIRIPNIYPQPRPLPSGQYINNSRPNYNSFNTYPTSNFNKNFNGYQIPNGSYNNGNRTYYSPQTNFTYGTPAVPNYQNYGRNNSYGSNKNNLHNPFGGNNYYPTKNNNEYTNNFNQSLQNPYQITGTNRPQTPYNHNIPQYNGSMEPNHFYYVPNNNGSQYDPRTHQPERFSY